MSDSLPDTPPEPPLKFSGRFPDLMIYPEQDDAPNRHQTYVEVAQVSDESEAASESYIDASDAEAGTTVPAASVVEPTVGDQITRSRLSARTTQACDSCRTGKKKCKSNGPKSCTECSSLQKECTWDRPRAPGRALRACDPCRSSRQKCTISGDAGTCDACLQTKTACVWETIARRRRKMGRRLPLQDVSTSRGLTQDETHLSSASPSSRMPGSEDQRLAWSSLGIVVPHDSSSSTIPDLDISDSEPEGSVRPEFV